MKEQAYKVFTCWFSTIIAILKYFHYRFS